jgi:hypothetical protein
MYAAGYSVPDTYWNDRFIELAQYFNFLSKDQVDSIIPPQLYLFIIIHHRYSASVEKLLLILDSLPIELSKVIFTSNSKELQIQINSVDHFKVSFPITFLQIVIGVLLISLLTL